MQTVRNNLKKISTVILVVAVFAAGFMVGTQLSISHAQNTVPLAIGDKEQAFAPLYEVFDSIQARYVDAGEVEINDLIDGAITGMIDSLGDPYSSYMDPEGFESFNSSFSGNMEGIGVVIRQDEETGNVIVVSLIRGAAAEAAGVRPGDVFVEVNGQDVRGMNINDLGTLVRGPAGTDVTITFERDAQPVTLTITRVRFEIPNVEYRMLDEGIAYISMAQFDELSRPQLDAALDALDMANAKGLIFDLRGNPGGLLTSAVDVASAFIPDGVILYESFGDGTERTFEATGAFKNVQVPIVVLIDEGSASASELVSGAMQDRGVATLIGEVSFGKGTVQTVQPLTNQGALRLTIARYLLPSRRWIHELGVEPDMLVPYERPADADPEAIDPQLQAAINHLLGN